MCDVITDPTNDDGFSGGVAQCPRSGTLAMGGIDPVLPAPFQDRVDRDQPSLIEDADLIGELMHFDDASRSVGNAVVVAADRDQAIMADPAFESPRRPSQESARPCAFAPRLV